MVLHAQIRAEPFYAANGYAPEGEWFMDAGIEHIAMRKALMGEPERPAPEIRLDQLTGLRTILSPARADRPFDFGGVTTAMTAAERRTARSARAARTGPRRRPGRTGRGAAARTPGLAGPRRPQPLPRP